MATVTAAEAPSGSVSAVSTRWGQLIAGFIVMMTISSPQYVWTFFTAPFQTATQSLLSEVQWTITILIVLQTWLSPLQGWLVDRFGPKLLISLGAVLSGLGWVASANVTSLWGLYATYGLLCGVGTGIVYIGVVGLMVRWFPDRRGFATGIVAAGYGFGAILTTFPIDGMMKASGYQQTLIAFGIIFAIVGFVAALFLRAPREEDVAPLAALTPLASSVSAGWTPSQMLRTPVFWLMFVMMSMMSTGGLMVITQFKSFAKSFGIADATTVVIFGVAMAAIPAALTFDRITNGLTRPFFGWVSDRIGRENTMALAFIMEGFAIWLMLYYRTDPFLFILLSGLVFFGWGEIFSLFPSTLTDTFGAKHATTNYGFLYMAQGVGSILGAPVAAMIFEATGSWMPVFSLIIGMDVLTGLLALFVLKPMRRRLMG
jgi:OFA family oxalate/formate antiporter-like MFS transporter